MKRLSSKAERRSHVEWFAFYHIILFTALLLLVATFIWTRDARRASDQTVNDLGRFYLEEITDRNVGNITLEIEKRTIQMERAMEVLDEEALRSEHTV